MANNTLFLGKLLIGLVPLILAIVSLQGACNGPTYPALINQPMTVATHNRDFFPIAHGDSENPSGDCNICHGGMASFEDFTCLMCHTHEKDTTDQAHRGLDGYTYDSNSCLSCHPSGEGALGRDDHTELYFPIDTSSSHKDPSCTECHTTGNYDVFSCIDCHEHGQNPMAEAHQGISGYEWESQSCFQCHPSGESELGRDDHTQLYFPINNGTKHEDPTCTECHTTGNYDAFSCIECHEHTQGPMAEEHQGVSGYEWESQSCFQCHPNGESELGRDDHTQLYFPINNGTKHEDPTCSECHTTRSYDAFSCIECHEHAQAPMAEEHQGVSGYEWESQSCFQCHPSGIAMDRSEHTDFPIDSGDKHINQSCGDCHKTSDYNDYTCIDCHTHDASKMNGAHNDVNSYSYTSPNCYSCHPDSIVLTKSEHSPWFPITSGDHSRYGCDDCHKTAGTYQEFTCIGCHAGEHTCREMDDEHEGEVRNYTCEDNACLNCHPDGKD